MNKKVLSAAAIGLPVLIGGLLYASSQKPVDEVQQTSEDGYVCPATGEVLPCPNCCPLKQE